MLKAKIQDMEQSCEALQSDFNNTCGDKKELEKSNIQLQELNNSYKLNISKLQEENKGLLDLKEVNKKLGIELGECKKLLADSQEKNTELNSSIKDKDSDIEKLNAEVIAAKENKETTVQELINKHGEKLQAVNEKAELQKDKAILELQKKYQQELQELQHKHNAEIEEYQAKYRSLLEQLEKAEKNVGNTHARATKTKKQDTTK